MAPTKKSSEKRQQTLLSCGFTMCEKRQNTLLRCGFTRITKPYSKAPSKSDDLILKRVSHTPGIGEVTRPIGANHTDILKDSISDVPSITKKEIEDIQVSIPPCSTSDVPTVQTKGENSRLSAENTQLRAELEAGLEELRNEDAENLKKSQSQTENTQVCGPPTQQNMKSAPCWMPNKFVKFVSAEVLEIQHKKKRTPIWVPKELLQFVPTEILDKAQLCAEHARRKNVKWIDLAMAGCFRDK